MGDERPPPEVTVRDPARPGQPVDVLVLGDDTPRQRPFTRHRVTRGLALLGILAVVATGLEVRERRVVQERERRDAAVVDLAVLPGDAVEVVGRVDDRLALRHTARLRNDGPREVTVLSGGIGAFGVVREVVLSPAEVGAVLLEQAVDCDGDRPAGGAATTMTLAVQTGAGVREVELELATPLDDPAPRLCGAAPPGVTADAVGVEVGRGSFTLSLDVATRASRPVAVLAATADAGFDVRIPELADGPKELPLPVLDIGVGVLRLTAEVSLVDCAAAEAFREPNRPGTLTVFVEEADGGDVAVPVSYDPDLLQDLVAQAC